MDQRQERAELRGAVYRGDAESVVTLLRERAWPPHALQLIGDGLLGALAARAEGIEGLATTCVAALRARDWEGDSDLADVIEAVLGTGPVPPQRQLRVDLDELAAVLEGDPVNGGGRIDLRSGEVWPQAAIEYAEESGEIDEDDAERWLWVECEGSHAGYNDMELFIAGLEDRDRADRLGIAIEGRGAFRRFKDVLSRWPELLAQWFAFSEDRQQGRARAWLADEGYAPAPRSQPE